MNSFSILSIRFRFPTTIRDLILCDSNIRYRFENVILHEGNYGDTLLPPDMHLMEIKMSTSIPLWLTGLMDEYKIRRTSFTKYGRIYEKEFLKRGGMPTAE